MKRILILDNYDSFTFNLVHLVESLTSGAVEVKRNDKIALTDIAEYDKILLSPGPGLPSEAGIMPDLVKEYSSAKSILGVCLGHQCIAEVFGGTLFNLERPVHGKSTLISVVSKNDYLFKDVSSPFQGGRYHSWVVNREGFPDSLEVTAVDENGMIMALSHKTFDIKGVQFHPESIMTGAGSAILKNWLNH